MLSHRYERLAQAVALVEGPPESERSPFRSASSLLPDLLPLPTQTLGRRRAHVDQQGITYAHFR